MLSKLKSSLSWQIGILIVAGFCFFLLGNNLYSLFDNSETHYSTVSREMANTGDYLNLYFNGENWYVHPPLYFWLNSTIGKLAGWTDSNMRLLEGIFGILGVIATYFLGLRLLNREYAFIGALILMSSTYYTLMSRLAIFDTLLNFFMIVNVFVFLKAYDEPKKKGLYFFLFSLFCTLSVLTKGPIGLLQPGIAIVAFLAWKRDLKFLLDWRVGLNFLVFLGITAPWYAHQLYWHGWDFFNIALRDYTWYRFFGVVENQTGPWYYYFLILLTFLPWISYLPSVIYEWVRARKINKGTNDTVLFFVLFIGLSFLFFSMAKTKLPNYIFSIFPFMSILIAYYFSKVKSTLSLLIPAGVLVVFSGVLVLYAKFGDIGQPYANERSIFILLFSILSASSVVFFVTLYLKRIKLAIYLLTAGMLAFILALATVGFPAFEKYKDSKAFVAILSKQEAPYQLMSYQVFSPYIMYYLNHHVQFAETLNEVKTMSQADPKPTFMIVYKWDLPAIQKTIPFTIVSTRTQQVLIEVKK